MLAGKIIHGAKYYNDFFEYNLPLVFYIVTIPVFIADQLGLFPIPVYIAFVTLVAILSILLCARVLRESIVYLDKPTYYTLIAALCFAFFLPCPTLCINEIGDKSFYMLAFVMPYFFTCFPIQNKMPRWVTVLIGILGGIGFCLKPNYFLIWMMMECYLMWREKKLFYWWRATNIYIGIVTIAYLYVLLVIQPEFIQKIIPVISYLYWGFAPYAHNSAHLVTIAITSFFESFIELFILVGLPVLLYFLLLSPPLKNRQDPIRQVLFWGFLSVYLEFLTELHIEGPNIVQIYPFAVLLVAKITLDFFRNIRSFSWLRGEFGLIVLSGLIYFYPYSEIHAAYTKKAPGMHTLFTEALLPYADKYAKGKSIFTIAPDCGIAFPLIFYAHSHWNYKFPNLPWPTFQIYEKSEKKELSAASLNRFNEAKRYYYDALHSALQNDPPALIIALEKMPEDKVNMLGIWDISDEWNFPGDLLKDEVFVQEWAHYTKIAEIARYDLYNRKFVVGVYKRL